VSYLELVESELEKFEIDPPLEQRRALAVYCEELGRWNKAINLTALTGVDLVRRLVAVPTWIACQLSLSGSLLDIGSGNGSPAIPFQITRPFRSTHLVEARGKRAAFLRHLIAVLKLQNVAVHRSRFETLLDTPEKPDWITLQALALTPKLVADIRRIASPTTTVVWITSTGSRGCISPTRSLSVPMTNTQVLLFQLDLS
jgi:16S rRNA (guanine527-N7)-methyltransferase